VVAALGPVDLLVDHYLLSHLRDPDVETHARQSGACYFVRKENLFDLARYLGRSVTP